MSNDDRSWRNSFHSLTSLEGTCGIYPDWKDADHFIKVSSWDLSEWSKVIYFYPKDFTFICPTEISAFQKVEARK